MAWTKEDIRTSIIRKPKHEPLYGMGRELFDEINNKIKVGIDIKVDDMAVKLANGFKYLLVKYPELYSQRYANLPITYHPRNKGNSEELKLRSIETITDGVDFLLAAKNNTLNEIKPMDLAIYARNHNCLYDNGKFNAHILISKLSNMRPFYTCQKPQENNQFKHCEAIGRTGYLIKLKQ
jgi:hypothetical protein